MKLRPVSLLQNFKKIKIAGRQLFRTKKVSAFFIYGGLLFNLIIWGLFFWFVRSEQSIVILHYNAFMGIDAIANFDIEKNYFQIFMAPIQGTFIFLLNLLIALVLSFQSQEIGSDLDEENFTEQEKVKKGYKKEKLNQETPQNGIIFFGVYLLLGGGFLLQLVVFLYTIAIIWVNR